MMADLSTGSGGTAGNTVTNVPQLVDHLFRHESGRMVAALTRSLGSAHLQLAEEVVQEALMQALRRWPFHGVPQRPGAWLHRVAHNLALDQLRRHTNFRHKEPEVRRRLETAAAVAGHVKPPEAHLPGEVTDDQLRLIFLCCHPEVPRDGRVALTLKTVAGLSVREIARAFLCKESTMAQRIVRAQRRIREGNFPFEVPSPEELPGRLDAVLEVLYLTFNEGYGAHEGDDLVRRDLCDEALRLTVCLAASREVDLPAVHALAALMEFQASRLPARVDAHGELVRLADQDRSLWDRQRIHRAFLHLDCSARGDEQTVYHLQAAIAAHHAGAPSASSTDWAAILHLYDQLMARNPSPIVVLNRAVALARLEGPRAGLDTIKDLAGSTLKDYYLLHATRGELWTQLGQRTEAASALRQALQCRCSAPERRFLERRLAALGSVEKQAAPGDGDAAL